MKLAFNFLLLLGVWHVQDVAGVGLRASVEEESINLSNIGSLLQELSKIQSDMASMNNAARAQALVYAKEKAAELQKAQANDLKTAAQIAMATSIASGVISMAAGAGNGALANGASKGTASQALEAMKASSDPSVSMGAKAYESTAVQKAVAEDKAVAATIESATESQAAMQKLVESVTDKLKAIQEAESSMMKKISSV